MAMPPMSLKEDLETLWESFKLPEEVSLFKILRTHRDLLHALTVIN
jgi:hypothetical protein